MGERTYLAVDLKSFYASAECVSRGLDPLDTNLVVADVSRTSKTICLAVSPALKSFGLGSRARLFEVEERVSAVNEQRRLRAPGHNLIGSSVSAAQLQANPQLGIEYIAAKPRMSYYLDMSAKIYGIYLNYASKDDIHVYSVDEVFIDVTKYLKYFGCSAHELARRIVADILEQTGITATAGIGTNLYLAKVAMDIVAKHIPADEDGVRIVELDERRYRELLWSHRPLTDFWRVGRGIARKLERQGIMTMGDIARCSLGRAGEYYNEDLLYRFFGVNAETLIDHAWGWEPCTIADIKAYTPENSSLSIGQVLARPYPHTQAHTVASEMADCLAQDLAAKGAVTDRVVLTVGFDRESLMDGRYLGPVGKDHYGRPVPKSVHGSCDLGRFTSSATAIRQAVVDVFERIADSRLYVRRLTVVAGRVRMLGETQTFEQPSLFENLEGSQTQQQATADRKELSLQRTVNALRSRFGAASVIKGMNLDEGATGMERSKQIGGHAA